MKSLRTMVMKLVGPRGAGIVRNGGYGLIAKLATTMNLFLAMPFVQEAAGPAGFGAWATLVSVAAFAAFLDFGLSSGAMNLIAGAHGRGDRTQVTALISIALRSLGTNAIVLALVGAIVVALVPWHALLGLGSSVEADARVAAGIAILSMVLWVPAGLALRVQLGTGDATTGYRHATAGQLVGCLATIIAAKAGASLPLLVACTLLPPVLAAILNTVRWIPRWPGLSLRRGPTATDSGLANAIRHESRLFLVLQVAAVIVHTSDLPLISAFVGAEQAGRYAIAQRLFVLIPIGMGLVWTPLWPAYRHALARREYGWVIRTLRWSAFGALMLASAAAATLGIGFEQLTAIWMRAPLQLPTLMLAGFATWAVLDAVGGAYGTFLNAISPRWLLIAISSSFAASSLLLKTWLASQGLVELMPWATLASFLAFDLLPFVLFWPRIEKEMRTRTY